MQKWRPPKSAMTFNYRPIYPCFRGGNLLLLAVGCCRWSTAAGEVSSTNPELCKSHRERDIDVQPNWLSVCWWVLLTIKSSCPWHAQKSKRRDDDLRYNRLLPSISYLTLTCRVTFPDDEKLKVYWSEESHLIGWVGHSYIALTTNTPLARLAAHLMMVITRNFDKTFCWEQTKTLLLIFTRMVLLL